MLFLIEQQSQITIANIKASEQVYTSKWQRADGIVGSLNTFILGTGVTKCKIKYLGIYARYPHSSKARHLCRQLR